MAFQFLIGPSWLCCALLHLFYIYIGRTPLNPSLLDAHTKQSMCHLFLTILFFFSSYGGHAHFFLSAEGNLLYCDSVLKLGDEVSDKSVTLLGLPPPPPPLLHHPQYGKNEVSTPTPILSTPNCTPTPLSPLSTPSPTQLYLRRVAKLDKRGCGAAPLINKRCSAPWGWPL